MHGSWSMQYHLKLGSKEVDTCQDDKHVLIITVFSIPLIATVLMVNAAIHCYFGQGEFLIDCFNGNSQ